MVVLKSKNWSQSAQVKKSINKIFDVDGLVIFIKCNINIVHYLDVTISLNDGNYKLYTKINNKIIHNHTVSNHTSSIKPHYLN